MAHTNFEHNGIETAQWTSPSLGRGFVVVDEELDVVVALVSTQEEAQAAHDGMLQHEGRRTVIHKLG